jgi:phosphocarrier protein HPr
MPTSSEPQVETSVVLGAALHARPAGQVVRAAAGFTAAVELVAGDRVAGAKGVLGLLGLGAGAGATLLIRATGPDAAEAVEAIRAVLAAAQ